MARYYLTVNPHGGVKQGLGILEKVKPLFNEAGAELTILETEYAGHATVLARTLPFEGYDGFCAIGGDGTLHEVINGMLKREDGKKIPIGLITGGTGNSFMHDMDCLDPMVATKRILTGRTRTIDIAEVDANGETIYGCNIVGWGMVTDVNFIAERLRWLGGQRYNIASIIEVLRHRQRVAKVVIDGRAIVADFGFILACNTVHTGRGMKMAPLAQLDDGLLDLIIIRKGGRIRLLTLFTKLFKGTHIGDPVVEYRQVKEFSIIPQDRNTLNIDGEILGSTPIHVKVLQRAIEVLV